MISEKDRLVLVESLKHAHRLAFDTLLKRLEERRVAEEHLSFRMNSKELTGFIPNTILEHVPHPDDVHMRVYPTDDVDLNMDFAIYADHSRVEDDNPYDELVGTTLEIHDLYPNIVTIKDFHAHLGNPKQKKEYADKAMTEFVDTLLSYFHALGITMIFDDASDPDLTAELVKRGAASVEKLTDVFYTQHPFVSQDRYSGAFVLFLEPSNGDETVH